MATSDIEIAAVVIDNGSGYIKAGLAGEDAPKTCFPSIVGKSRVQGISIAMDQRDTFVGNEAYEKRGTLNISQPIQNGLIVDWEGAEKIWHHCYFNELKVPPEEHPCLLTETPLNTPNNRESMTELVFEVFTVPSFFIASQAVLALYSSGKTTGIVLDSGDSVTHTVPIYEGYSLPHAIMKVDIGGRDLTNYLMKLLKESGISFSSLAEVDLVRTIKEKTCYVANNYQEEIKFFAENSSKDVNYMLPDGSVVTLNEQQFKCPEALFQPSLLDKDLPGVHEMLYQSIMKCDPEIRRDIIDNVVLAGGSTLFAKMKERVVKEIGELGSSLKAKSEWNAAGPAERKYSVWIGGSILSSLSTFQAMWITEKEYSEIGPSVVHRKCF